MLLNHRTFGEFVKFLGFPGPAVDDPPFNDLLPGSGFCQKLQEFCFPVMDHFQVLFPEICRVFLKYAGFMAGQPEFGRNLS